MSGVKRVYEETKAPRNDNKDAPLPLGTFAQGTSLFRNKCHEGETFQNAHVSIHNLLLPECTAAFLTTFVVPDIQWLESIFSSNTQLTIITHKGQGPTVGYACMETVPQHVQWIWISCRPHTGGCFHSKLLLFRNHVGLRVVVSGNNLTQYQWQNDRDCMWIQDFFCQPKSTITGSTSGGGYCEFQETLQSFVQDISQCHSANDKDVMQTRIINLFQGIDFSTSKGRLVVSFPHAPHNNHKNATRERGGYTQLACVIRSFQSELQSGSDGESNEDENERLDTDTYTDTIPEGSILYTTSGSMGNVTPDFLLQMYKAFVCGQDVHAPKSTTWESMCHNKVRCLWPSRETALTMNLISLIGNTRPMPRSHWHSIPELAKRQIFYDAPPNPPSLLETCHAVTHAKVMYYSSPSWNVVYVGSHNFSKSAWGLRGEMPKNVELGVVLATTSPLVRNEWKNRLPCALPNASDTSPISYIPASAHSGIQQVLKEGRVEDAIAMTIEWLTCKETRVISDDIETTKFSNENAQGDSNVIKADVIDLCDSDS